MPPLILPDDLLQQLQESETGTINGTDGPGVAVYWKTDRTARADIFLELILDSCNISHEIGSVNSSIKIQFSLPPVLSCQSGDLHFDPRKDEVVSIKVSRRPRADSVFAGGDMRSVEWAPGAEPLMGIRGHKAAEA